MDEGERLAKLAQDLYDDWQSQSGGTIPRRISPDDAAAIAMALQEEMDAGTAARDAYAREQGLTIACEAGCNACCENLIVVHEPEAIAVAQWLAKPENHPIRDAFTGSYHRWREQLGDIPERAQKALDGGDSHGYEALAKEVWNKRVLCPFNRDGKCTVYPVRPNVCRECHAVETSEHCSSASAKNPKTVRFPPLEQFRTRTRPLMAAAHVAVRGDRQGLSPLGEAVYRLLQTGSATRKPARGAGGKIGRNQPCPCGSGKKYKRCCGA